MKAKSVYIRRTASRVATVELSTTFTNDDGDDVNGRI
jgi:hypothetical protein